jgi:hypothetical protein
LRAKLKREGDEIKGIEGEWEEFEQSYVSLIGMTVASEFDAFSLVNYPALFYA